MFKYELRQPVWYLDTESLKPCVSKIQSRNFQEEIGRPWPFIEYVLFDGETKLSENYIFATKEELLNYISE